MKNRNTIWLEDKGWIGLQMICTTPNAFSHDYVQRNMVGVG